MAFSGSGDNSAWRRHWLPACLFIVALAFELFYLQALNLTEMRLADVYQRRHAVAVTPDADIVVIDADDASLASMQEIAGLWAWPREIHADLIDGLAALQPRAIVFDMAFAERDARTPVSDARLDEAVRAAGNVYLASTRLAEQNDAAGVPLATLADAFGVTQPGRADARASFVLPHAVSPQAWRLGLINSVKDEDGVQRRAALRADVGGWQLPSLPARVAGDFGGARPAGDDFLLRWSSGLHTNYSYGALYRTLTEERLKLDEAGRQVFDAQLAPLFRDKILVIGSSASGLFDHHVTPLASNYPGVYLLATAIDNLKNGRAVRVAPPGAALAVGALLIAALARAFARRRNPLLSGGLLALTTLAALAAADAMLARGLLLPVVTPLAFAWGWFLLEATRGYLRERRTRDQAVSLFGRFLNPNVVRQIVEHGETVESLSGRSSEVTVLFSDIRGFTTLSETRDPQEVVKLLNRYFDRQVDVVFRHGGTLDKFIGDCIMAFWGAPVDDPQHAAHAVAAALEMQEVLLDFKKALQAEAGEAAAPVEFDVGIGVHSGNAVVGFIGAQKKLDYTAIGDTVNLASRVEGLTKDVARVLVTRDTMESCAGMQGIRFIPKGAFAVKGRAAKVELFEPVRNPS